ncbi:MAG: substrate-binding domain-containing protein [Acidobacteriota bacterium]
MLLFIQIADPAPPVATGRLVIIVSPAVPVNELSLADLRRIYLGRITRWPDGRRIVPAVLPSKSAEQRAFLLRVVQMGEIDYAQHWIGQVFRGEAAAPPHLASSSAEARRFVAEHPQAIAFVSAADVDETVRVVTIERKSAGQPGYPLAW